MPRVVIVIDGQSATTCVGPDKPRNSWDNGDIPMPVHTLIRPVSGRAAGVKKPFHVHPPFEGERNFLLRHR
jgi:hypothetical protein